MELPQTFGTLNCKVNCEFRTFSHSFQTASQPACPLGQEERTAGGLGCAETIASCLLEYICPVTPLSLAALLMERPTPPFPALTAGPMLLLG